MTEHTKNSSYNQTNRESNKNLWDWPRKVCDLTWIWREPLLESGSAPAHNGFIREMNLCSQWLYTWDEPLLAMALYVRWTSAHNGFIREMNPCSQWLYKWDEPLLTMALYVRWTPAHNGFISEMNLCLQWLYKWDEPLLNGFISEMNLCSMAL